MNCTACGGWLYAEPALDAHVGPLAELRTQLTCGLCGRSPNAAPRPLPLVQPNRLIPQRGHGRLLNIWKAGEGNGS